MGWIKQTIISLFATTLILVSIGGTNKTKIEVKEVVVIETLHDTLYLDKTEYKSVYELQPNYRHRVPSKSCIKSMDALANHILIPLNNYISRKVGKEAQVNITSFCRDWSKGSQHTKGEAVDIDMDWGVPGITNRMIYDFVKDSLDFDQLIMYNSTKRPTHIHISFIEGNNRKETILARKRRSGTRYYKL